MKTLDAQYRDAKAAYDKAARLHGPRSIKAKEAQSALQALTARILRRDNRRRSAA